MACKELSGRASLLVLKPLWDAFEKLVDFSPSASAANAQIMVACVQRRQGFFEPAMRGFF